MKKRNLNCSNGIQKCRLQNSRIFCEPERQYNGQYSNKRSGASVENGKKGWGETVIIHTRGLRLWRFALSE